MEVHLKSVLIAEIYGGVTIIRNIFYSANTVNHYYLNIVWSELFFFKLV